MMSRENLYRRFDYARRYGFSIDGAAPWTGYVAKPGSHDDGAYHGPFLGGLGSGTFSRDLSGRFSRWHLQPGLHVAQTIPQARLLCRWSNAGGEAGSRWIGVGEAPGWGDYRPSAPGFAENARHYAVLFPECFERYDDPELPFRLLLRYWSPLVFGDEAASSMPVVYFSLHVENQSDTPLDFAAAFFWPNLLGWRNSRVPSVDRGDNSRPGQTHSGNTARGARDARGVGGASDGVGRVGHDGGAVQGGAQPAEPGAPTTAVVQQRRPEQEVSLDLEGEVALSVTGPANGTVSREICMKSDLNAIGVPPGEQQFTQAWAEQHFLENGALPGTEETWRAHWHEPVSSAVAARAVVAPQGDADFDVTLAWDMPLVVFGSERTWEKRYTAEFGASGRAAERICERAGAQREAWLSGIDAGRAGVLESLEEAGIAQSTAGAVLNELFLVVGNGTAWVAREHGRPAGLGAPTLGGGEHFAFLEGFDTGYYYYNTLDLWAYAFAALSFSWPEIGDGVFRDLLDSLETPDERERIVYRLFEKRPILKRHKAPHDLGCPMEDPWHELNGYTMRDDPNSWKDHNPALIVSFYLHKQLRGAPVDATEWDLLKAAGEHTLGDDTEGDGLPRHKEFGDSTWDALAFRGVSAYSAGLTLAAYCVLRSLAEGFGENELRELYSRKLSSGTEVFEKLLWTGAFYRTDSEGRYRETVMSDALLGPYYAALSGLGELLPVERVRSHLSTAFEYNAARYAGGRHGALLVSDGRGERFTPDGGEELQINEVIVGSAWALCAMMEWYGLRDTAGRLGESLRRTLYEDSGLQFRTPAAFDADGAFRAPMNMRPLSVWLLTMNQSRRASAQRKSPL